MKKARIAAVGGYIYSRTFYWMQSGLKLKSLEAVVVLNKDATSYHRLIKTSTYQNRLNRSRVILAQTHFFTYRKKGYASMEGLMEITTVKIENPDGLNFILGQSHFIKTVEDIYEIMMTTVPMAKFAVAFCEASDKCLIRHAATDEALLELAQQNALNLSAGHSFIIFMKDLFPINVLNAIKNVPEVCRIFCATANPVEVIIAETELGRGILGVIDGFKSKGIEDDAEIEVRKEFLRKIGYKQ